MRSTHTHTHTQSLHACLAAIVATSVCNCQHGPAKPAGNRRITPELTELTDPSSKNSTEHADPIKCHSPILARRICNSFIGCGATLYSATYACLGQQANKQHMCTNVALAVCVCAQEQAHTARGVL